MNERIEKLGEQATIHSPEGFYTYTQIDASKFAELIVKECADIAKHHVMNISTYADAEFAEEQIKQHFGVEE